MYSYYCYNIVLRDRYKGESCMLRPHRPRLVTREPR